MNINSTQAEKPAKERGPIHVTGVVMTHDTPNPQRPRTAVSVAHNQDGRLYVSLGQSENAKDKLVFFADDWKFISEQVDTLIGKERLLK